MWELGICAQVEKGLHRLSSADLEGGKPSAQGCFQAEGSLIQNPPTGRGWEDGSWHCKAWFWEGPGRQSYFLCGQVFPVIETGWAMLCVCVENEHSFS